MRRTYFLDLLLAISPRILGASPAWNFFLDFDWPHSIAKTDSLLLIMMNLHSPNPSGRSMPRDRYEKELRTFDMVEVLRDIFAFQGSAISV